MSRISRITCIHGVKKGMATGIVLVGASMVTSCATTKAPVVRKMTDAITSAQQSETVAPDTSAQIAATDAAATTPDMAQDTLKTALGSAIRSDEARARDAYRHPAETLSFFGFEPSMSVVELASGSGWYTDVLAAATKASNGSVVAATFSASNSNPKFAKYAKSFDDKIAKTPENYSTVKRGVLDPGGAINIGEKNSADMVLTFRNFHNWISANVADDVVQSSFDVLKPGGVFGVVQHRAKGDKALTETAESGYLSEAALISLVEAKGFKLVGKSEINANPQDAADHPKGVWTLPPKLALGETDKEKYVAIGESDRMTLKFMKPAAE